MPKIIHLEEIRSIVKNLDVVAAMQEGFIQYSNGNAVVPPVGELLFDDPPGDVHIKYGYIRKDEFYVIKIASGFYNNTQLGIPSGQGLMLLFRQNTGQLEAVLLDEAYLTDIRTAAAGALAASYFAPKKLKAIGIIGTGVQARLQLQHIQNVRPCHTVWLWGRNKEHVQEMQSELGESFEIHIASSCSEVAQNANLIVTTTPSKTPLLLRSDIISGTCIIAVGSDTRDKQELESGILQMADFVVADSIPQSKSRGEIFQAVKNGFLAEEQIVELGRAIQDPDLHRSNDEQSIVVDLTGVAVQDMMIASAVYLQSHKNN